MSIYPKGSFNITVSFEETPKVPLVTTYTVGNLMTDASAGKGIARVTIFDSSGNLVSDADGQLLQDRPMYWKGNGVAVYNVAPGVTSVYAGTVLYAYAVYGVKDASGNLDWRQPEEVKISISSMKYAPNTNI